MTLTFYFNNIMDAKRTTYTTIEAAEKVTFAQAKQGAWVAGDFMENMNVTSSLRSKNDATLTGNYSGSIPSDFLTAQNRIVSYKLHYFHASRQQVALAVQDLQTRLFSSSVNCNNATPTATPSVNVGGILVDTISVKYGTFQSINMATVTFELSYSFPFALGGFTTSMTSIIGKMALACLQVPNFSSSTATSILTFSHITDTISTARVTMSEMRGLQPGYVMFIDSGAYYVRDNWTIFQRIGGAVSGAPIVMASNIGYSVTTSGDLPIGAQFGTMTIN